MKCFFFPLGAESPCTLWLILSQGLCFKRWLMAKRTYLLKKMIVCLWFQILWAEFMTLIWEIKNWKQNTTHIFPSDLNSWKMGSNLRFLTAGLNVNQIYDWRSYTESHESITLPQEATAHQRIKQWCHHGAHLTWAGRLTCSPCRSN